MLCKNLCQNIGKLSVKDSVAKNVNLYNWGRREKVHESIITKWMYSTAILFSKKYSA